jgi:hypothetical protein
MNQKLKTGFFVLVIFQAMHSIEEYFGELWNVLPPARWLTGLVSKDHEFGFFFINIGLFLFGILSWIFIIRKDKFLANIILWFWIVLEVINGIGHPIWSIMEKSYTPGVFTSFLLLTTSLYLIRIYFRKT